MSEESSQYALAPPPANPLAEARARAADLEYRLQAAQAKIRNQATEISTQQRRLFVLEQRLAHAERRLQGGRR